MLLLPGDETATANRTRPARETEVQCDGAYVSLHLLGADDYAKR
jgi:hypothetical protein